MKSLENNTDFFERGKSPALFEEAWVSFGSLYLHFRKKGLENRN
jgi:hypothetical protein